MPDLLTITRAETTGEQLVAAAGEVLARFDHRTQTSGNISWLVRTPRGDLFVKTAGYGQDRPEDVPVPFLSHPARVELLRHAAELARSVRHPSLAQLRNVIELPSGPALVYDRAPGELIHAGAAAREDPGSAYQRFAVAQAGLRLRVFDQLLDAHVRLEQAGWVASDLYDGALMVDLSDGALTLIDLDSYHRGPFVNEMGRMFGSDRFMAPEEYERGARIDERTTVFTLGRLIAHFGTALTENLAVFCGPPALRTVIERATRPDSPQRFPDVRSLHAAWSAARLTR